MWYICLYNAPTARGPPLRDLPPMGPLPPLPLDPRDFLPDFYGPRGLPPRPFHPGSLPPPGSMAPHPHGGRGFPGPAPLVAQSSRDEENVTTANSPPTDGPSQDSGGSSVAEPWMNLNQLHRPWFILLGPDSFQYFSISCIWSGWVKTIVWFCHFCWSLFKWHNCEGNDEGFDFIRLQTFPMEIVWWNRHLFFFHWSNIMRFSCNLYHSLSDDAFWEMIEPVRCYI